MTNKLYSGSTTNFDPSEWSGGDLERIVGDGIVLNRNSFWKPSTVSSPAFATTTLVPGDGDIFQIKCDGLTSATNKIEVTAAAGQTIDGDSTFEITSPFAWSRHRYNLTNSDWELIQGYAG